MDDIPEINLFRTLRSRVPGDRGPRLLALARYLRDPVAAQLRWMRGGFPPVFAPRVDDASMLVVASAEGMRHLSVNQDTVWVRPASAGVRIDAAKHPTEAAATRLISTTNGVDWRARHEVMSPALRGRQTVETFAASTRSMMRAQAWYMPEEGEIDLLATATEAVVDNAWALIFGEPATPYEDRVRINALVDTVLGGALSPTTALLPFDLPGLPYRRWLAALRELHAWGAELILRKLESGDRGSVAGMMAHRRLAGGADRDTAQRADAVEELLGDMVALYVTMRDGPAATVAWTLLLLALHPHVQAMLRAAVVDGDPPADSDPPILDWVVNESMRLLPSSFVLNPRLARVETEIDGVRAPRGAMAFGSILMRHRDPVAWGPNADRFDPYRWPDARPTPYDFLPFGQGPRRCVGDRFATMQTKIAVAEFCRARWFDVVPEAPYDYRVNAVVLQPADGTRLRVRSTWPDGEFSRGATRVCGTIGRLVPEAAS